MKLSSGIREARSFVFYPFEEIEKKASVDSFTCLEVVHLTGMTGMERWVASMASMKNVISRALFERLIDSYCTDGPIEEREDESLVIVELFEAHNRQAVRVKLRTAGMYEFSARVLLAAANKILAEWPRAFAVQSGVSLLGIEAIERIGAIKVVSVESFRP